jgi:hypothetical protein
MQKYLKKIAKKIGNIPPPEEVFNKKALLFALIILALIFDILIINNAKSFPEFEEVKKRVETPFEKDIKKMLANHPMEKMAPYISTKDERVAAFLIGIGKKESNWGKRSPKKDGQDCFNYWGYRGKSENMTESGYTCFSSPRQAISIVGGRIDRLVNESNLDTPEKMIVWKCGWDCSWDNPVAMKKWVADVGFYYRKVYQ